MYFLKLYFVETEKKNHTYPYHGICLPFAGSEH